MRIRPAERREEFPITLEFRDFKQDQGVILKGLNKTTFSGGSDTLVLTPASVGLGKATFIAESPTSEASLSIDVIISDSQKNVRTLKRLDIKKNDGNPIATARDNKHGGPRYRDSEFVRLDTTVDALSRTLSLFPPKGGIVANVWQGAPFVAPMASHSSWDEDVIWVTDLDGGPDDTGAVWQVPMPSIKERAAMYSPGNAWKIGDRPSDR